MAPRLAQSKVELIESMIHDKSLNDRERAQNAGCSMRAIRRIRSNIRQFDSVRAPSNRPGRPRNITPAMLDVLCDRLTLKSYMYQDEMADYLWDEFEVVVAPYNISRALKSIRWSKKKAQRIAREQNAELRDFYLYKLLAFKSYHLVYIDESGCDKRDGFRRTGWSPIGSTPVHRAKFHRSRRHQILPAYTQDGILHYQVFQGSTDTEVFESFLEELLPQCGRWPEPNSVLIMDNASFHRSERIEQMCRDAGVKLVYLPPYSPDLNPIEEFFSELKSFIRRHWQAHAELPLPDFEAFLRWCVATVGDRARSARGHFRHAGVDVEEP